MLTSPRHDIASPVGRAIGSATCRSAAFQARLAQELAGLAAIGPDSGPVGPVAMGRVLLAAGRAAAAAWVAGLPDRDPDPAPASIPDPISDRTPGFARDLSHWATILAAPKVPAPASLVAALGHMVATLTGDETLRRAWSAVLFPAFSAAGLSGHVLADPARYAQPLTDPACADPALHAWALQVWPLLLPVEKLLAKGGDDRLDLALSTRRNRYGVGYSPRPRAVALSSSTASSPSAAGFAAACHARRALVHALVAGSPFALVAGQAVAGAKAFVAGYFRADSPRHVVLAASGTDCALAALALCAGQGQPVTTILPGPEETGSGVPLAARGRHFATRTALGRAVVKGAMIEGFNATNSCVAVPVRAADGTPLPEAEVLAACVRQAEQACAAGRRVLLYVIDVSKTGLMVPTSQGVAVIEALRARYSGAVDVLVDACQARLMPERVRAYLDLGWAVMVTGSKFYTGPAFSGALLLPEAWRQRLVPKTLPATQAPTLPQILPPGLADYAWRDEWPATPAARHLAEGLNAGLLLRWRAAEAEMTAFAAVTSETRLALLDRFLSGATRLLSACDYVRDVSPPAPVRAALPDAPNDARSDDPSDARSAAWDTRQTVLTFVLLRPQNGTQTAQVLDLVECRRVYDWLQADLSACVPPDQRDLAALPCYVGQPVALPCPSGMDGGGRQGPVGGLRLAASARHVSGTAAQAMPGGQGATSRVDDEITRISHVLAKIGLILRHWEPISQMGTLSSA
ncbi:MAG: hypothetical protein ABF791_10480 [Acetobacter sp.]|uniref:hypothetical protein n=1 Tax=Acetobacter sp. TaxID=440 RepID=UPI0039E98C75